MREMNVLRHANVLVLVIINVVIIIGRRGPDLARKR